MTKGLHISNLSLQSINLEFAQLTIVIVSIRSQKNKNKTIDGSVHGNSGIRVNNNKNEKTESNHEESALTASTKNPPCDWNQERRKPKLINFDGTAHIQWWLEIASHGRVWQHSWWWWQTKNLIGGLWCRRCAETFYQISFHFPSNGRPEMTLSSASKGFMVFRNWGKCS